jgi:hypothetical protein
MITKADILKQLASLDLSRLPYNEVRSLIDKLGAYGIMSVDIPKGRYLLRARQNFNGERFSQAHQLSYVPKEKNGSYKRASTPYTTMFYGSFFPDELYNGSVDTARLIGVTEACSLLRDKSIYEGEAVLTFGKWLVKKDIPVCVVIHNKNYITKNPLIKKFNDRYTEFISQVNSEMRDDSNMILNFFADQFAKPVEHEFEYLISAVFTEKIISLNNQGIAVGGILYPSIKTEGEGLNVSITPKFMECLELKMAIECTVYKKGDKVVLANNKLAELKGNSKEFHLETINNPKEYVSRETALHILNGNH